MANLTIAKDIINKFYDDALCGIFNTRNVVGDEMVTLFDNGELKIDICYDYNYFEVFGLTDEQFKELEDYYNSI